MKIPITPESEALDKRASNAFITPLKARYTTAMNKGRSAMDIYQKIGKLVLSQPDDFAYKFGFSVKFREKIASRSPWGPRGHPFEGRDDSFA